MAVGLTADNIGERLDSMRQEVARRTGGDAPTRFLVQQMVEGGAEIILGMHRDPVGTAVMLGMGGVTAELLQDTVIELLPQSVEGLQGLSDQQALAMVRQLKTWPLLDGYRGRPLLDVSALVQTIVEFSRMVALLDDRLIEAEINPIFVLQKGLGVCAAERDTGRQF